MTVDIAVLIAVGGFALSIATFFVGRLRLANMGGTEMHCTVRNWRRMCIHLCSIVTGGKLSVSSRTRNLSNRR